MPMTMSTPITNVNAKRSLRVLFSQSTFHMTILANSCVRSFVYSFVNFDWGAAAPQTAVEVPPLSHESFDKLHQFECKVSAPVLFVLHPLYGTDLALELQQP